MKGRLDYWRKKYLIPAIDDNKKIALIGIGGAKSYLMQKDEKKLIEIWDPYRLSRSCINYCVYDIDEELVNIARGIGIKSRVHDMTSGPLEEFYDYIFAGDVIEHVDNPVAFLKNIRDSLYRDGIMVVTTPNSVYWRYFITDLYEEFPEHNFTFNKKHFINLSRKIGLETIEIKSFQTNGAVNSISRKILQYIHYAMASIGRGNSLVMVAKSASEPIT